MTGPTASDYDARAADLVVRTLRAVADATPIDSTPLNVDPSVAVLPGADVDGSIRRRRRARWLVGVTAAAAAAALVVAAPWTQDDGRVETSPPSETPSDAARRPLADEQVVARGEVDGEPWSLYAQPFENGLMCLNLTGGGGGCGSVPTNESPLGAVYQAWGSIEGSRFVHGAVVREAAEVTVELANGEELSVEPSQPTFGFRFYVIPIPAGPDAVAVTVLDDEGRELERLELKAVEEVLPPR
jgi:hypothetical protein